ncbi:het-domain-containing protein, partial [Fusarium bulbicola]
VYIPRAELGNNYFSQSQKHIEEVLEMEWRTEFRTSRYDVFKSSTSGPKGQRDIKSVESSFRSPSQHLYTPLDPAADEIRLIFISVGTSGQLFAKMKHVSKGTRLPYIALSYVWGGDHKPNSLLVNGVPVNITENLDAALRSQVVLDYSSKGVTVWVDAICINQEDVQERNIEVLRMRNIYAQSLETICWLGKSAGSSDQAFDFLASLNTNRGSKPTEQQRIGLYQLFSRAWWLRVWTIQEAVVPPALRLACGNCHIKIGDGLLWSLHATVVTLESEMALPPSFRLSDQSLRRLQILYSLRSAWFNSCSLGVPLDLLTLLVASRHASATDPRDKVFGVLALTPEGQSLISRPDYRRSKREVFSQLVVAWATHYNSIDILDKIQCVAEYDSLKGHHGDANAPSTRYDGTDMAFSALVRTVCGGQLSESIWASLDTITFRVALRRILRDQGLDQTAASKSEADKYIRAWFHNNSRFKVGNITIGELVSQLPSTQSESDKAPRDIDESMQALRESFIKVTRGRLLFTTATGYLGISRQTLMPGDVAFLVPDCSAPLIVRQNGQMFKLVGDSYIHSNKGKPSVYGHWDQPKSVGKFTELKRLVVN